MTLSKDRCIISTMEKRSRSHRQIGIVGEIASDATFVKIIKPKKEAYTHAFDAQLFGKAGFKSGDILELTYTKKAQPGKVSVNLTIRRIGPALTEGQLMKRYQRTLGTIDLGKVGEAFGSYMPLKAHESDK